MLRSEKQSGKVPLKTLQSAILIPDIIIIIIAFIEYSWIVRQTGEKDMPKKLWLESPLNQEMENSFSHRVKKVAATRPNNKN